PGRSTPRTARSTTAAPSPRPARIGKRGEGIKDSTRPRFLAEPGPRGLGREPARAGSRGREGYGRSWAVPGSETAPGPGRSPAASTVALKVGWMQKMLTNVESVARPVAEGAGWRAGLGDRAGPTARGTEGPGVALLAVGPRAVAVGAGGGRAAAREALLGCRLVAAAGAEARAAVERIAGADARTIDRAPRSRVAFEAAGAGGGDVTAVAADHVVLAADRLTRLGHRSGRQGEGDREAADVHGHGRRAVVGGREV